MKKIKLLSSLTTLGVVATATPIIATSCSNSKQEITDITVNGKKIEDYKADVGESNVYKAENFSGKVNGKDVPITNLHISTTDSSIIPVDWNEGDNSFYVSTTNHGECKLTFTVEDKDGNKGTISSNVHVHAYVSKTYKIVKDSSGEPTKIQSIQECYECGEERTLSSEQDWNKDTDSLCKSVEELSTAVTAAYLDDQGAGTKMYRFFLEGNIGDVTTITNWPKKATIYCTESSIVGSFNYTPTYNSSFMIFDGVLFNGTEDTCASLHIKKNSAGGINIDYLTIQNCKFDSNACMDLDSGYATYNFTVNNCEFGKIYSNAHDHIKASCSFNWVWIYGNYFHDWYYNALQVGGDVKVSYQIEDNTFYGGEEPSDVQSGARTLRYSPTLDTMPQIMIDRNTLYKCDRDDGGESSSHPGEGEQYKGGIMIKQNNGTSNWDFEEEFVHCSKNVHDGVELTVHIDNEHTPKWVWFSKDVAK